MYLGSPTLPGNKGKCPSLHTLHGNKDKCPSLPTLHGNKCPSSPTLHGCSISSINGTKTVPTLDSLPLWYQAKKATCSHHQGTRSKMLGVAARSAVTLDCAFCTEFCQLLLKHIGFWTENKINRELYNTVLDSMLLIWPLLLLGGRPTFPDKTCFEKATSFNQFKYLLI